MIKQRPFCTDLSSYLCGASWLRSLETLNGVGVFIADRVGVVVGFCMERGFVNPLNKLRTTVCHSVSFFGLPLGSNEDNVTGKLATQPLSLHEIRLVVMSRRIAPRHRDSVKVAVGVIL